MIKAGIPSFTLAKMTAFIRKDQAMLKNINNFLIKHENLLASLVFMGTVWGFTVLMMI
jgi:hypothetical protein